MFNRVSNKQAEIEILISNIVFQSSIKSFERIE